MGPVSVYRMSRGLSKCKCPILPFLDLPFRVLSSRALQGMNSEETFGKSCFLNSFLMSAVGIR